MDKITTHTRHLATLDGLRGIAALIVLALHICELTHLPFKMPHADMAVDFFFMLSGYVIAKAYEAKLASTMTFPRFVTVRLARLYPMIFISVLMGGFVLAIRMMTTHTLTADQLIIVVLSTLIMLPSSALAAIYPDTLFAVNPPLWSLFFEFAINFTYAPVVRWLTNWRLLVTCILSGCALTWIAIGNHGLALGWGPSTFFAGYVRALFPFALGILIYRCAPRRQWPGWVTTFLMGALAVALFMPYFKGSWLYEMVVLILVFPPIVMCGAGCRNGFILNNVCLALGELSYPLYVMNHSILRVIFNAIQMLHLKLKIWPQAGLCFFATIMAATAILILWDMPVRRWLGRGSVKAEPAKPAVTISPNISGF